jgi:hypothetical protein
MTRAAIGWIALWLMIFAMFAIVVAIINCAYWGLDC